MTGATEGKAPTEVSTGGELGVLVAGEQPLSSNAKATSGTVNNALIPQAYFGNTSQPQTRAKHSLCDPIGEADWGLVFDKLDSISLSVAVASVVEIANACKRCQFQHYS